MSFPVHWIERVLSPERLLGHPIVRLPGDPVPLQQMIVSQLVVLAAAGPEQQRFAAWQQAAGVFDAGFEVAHIKMMEAGESFHGCRIPRLLGHALPITQMVGSQRARGRTCRAVAHDHACSTQRPVGLHVIRQGRQVQAVLPRKPLQREPLLLLGGERLPCAQVRGVNVGAAQRGEVLPLVILNMLDQ